MLAPHTINNMFSFLDKVELLQGEKNDISLIRYADLQKTFLFKAGVQIMWLLVPYFNYFKGLS